MFGGTRRRPRWTNLSRAAAGGCLALLAACGNLGTSSDGAPDTGATATGGATGSARTQLAALPVKGRAAMTGYSRDRFGTAWADTDHNGCDTRNDVLRRDLRSVTFKRDDKDCTVLSGDLADTYTAKTIRFVRGGASEVDIDHVVALGDAWQTGAAQWTPAKRLALANDPLNLLAVDASANRQKGDSDAASWLPPNKGVRCAYVARQVGVKTKYGLWVTTAEKQAMDQVLAGCPGEPAPRGGNPTEATTGR